MGFAVVVSGGLWGAVHRTTSPRLATMSHEPPPATPEPYSSSTDITFVVKGTWNGRFKLPADGKVHDVNSKIRRSAGLPRGTWLKIMYRGL